MKKIPVTGFIHSLSSAHREKVMSILTESVTEDLSEDLRVKSKSGLALLGRSYFILDAANDVGHTHYSIETEYEYAGGDDFELRINAHIRSVVEFDTCDEFRLYYSLAQLNSKSSIPSLN